MTPANSERSIMQQPGRSQSEVRESEGMMMGLVGQRRQLVSEIEELQERKVDLIGRLTAASREQATMYRQTIAETDQQLASARNALRGIDNAIAARQGTPVATPAPEAPEAIQGPQGPQGPQPPQIWRGWETLPPAFPASDPLPLYLSGGALTLVALAIVAGMVFARRLRRETVAAFERLYQDTRADLQKLTVGVDAMSVELERIGEGQRFVTKALVEKKETV